MRIPESELIINSDGSVFHLHIRPEQLADNVILVGDPERVAFFKPFFNTIKAEGASREFHWFTGAYNTREFTILSTGIGTDNIDIVMTELDALANVDFNTREELPNHRTLKILRIGTCGAVQPDIPIGSFIFSHISVGTDGLMNWYANRDKIVLADFEDAFKKHMGWNAHLADPYFVRNSSQLIKKFEDCTVKGMTVSAPGFYGPQGRCVRQALTIPDLVEKFESFSFNGYRITNIEMESSAIAGIAANLGHESGTVCCAIANRHCKEAQPNYHDKIKELIQLCLDRLSE